MGVVIIDGTTVKDFVSDEVQFKKSVDERFAALDLNNDGVLSRSELQKAFESMILIETHFGIEVATPPDQLIPYSISSTATREGRWIWTSSGRR
ncbi:putative EF-hand domain pair protein [Rosa chinensis]|uniref:Putative EF-hand domain pair protein n=1 Tax=Rosa chinensis TaxID=74649 RepID=A0A2P6SBN2_ROSCH|nr:putative EF-hand domain pair protein [Rosa chinensis]